MLSNEKIKDLITKINDNPSDTIPTDLLKRLVEVLADSEVLCPVRDDEIVPFKLGPQTFIPASCDMDDFKKAFNDESPEIFKFSQLKEFKTREHNGIFLNPGNREFILNNRLCNLIFNKNRKRKPVSEGYDVKVRLNDFRPLTWRDLILPDNMTFMELDDALKTLWGFDGSHLSCFLIKTGNLTIMDKKLSNDTMMDCDFDASTTTLSEIFDKYDKVTYWYDFGDDWRFDIEVKKKVDYDKDYVTIKRYKGKYNPIEDCSSVYGLSEIVYYAEHPEEADESYYCELVEYLEEFDMELSQLMLENKNYIKSLWYESQY